MKVKSEREVAQSCLTLSDPMDCMQPTRLLHPWDFSRQEYWSGVPLPSPSVSLGPINYAEEPPRHGPQQHTTDIAIERQGL